MLFVHEITTCGVSEVIIVSDALFLSPVPSPGGWSGGAMVLGKPPVLGRRRAMTYCACSRCGWGLFSHFYAPLAFSSLSPFSGRRPDID